MKKIRTIAATVLCICAVAGGLWFYVEKQEQERSCTKELFAMDTVMSFTAYGRNAEDAVDAAVKEVQRLDDLLSTGKETSEISQLNQKGSLLVSEDTESILKEAQTIYKETDGLFDITIYPLMKLWGFPTQEYHVPDQAELNQVLPLVDASKVEISDRKVTIGAGQEVDLGGIAKGYTSGRVMEIYKEYGITSGMVSLGGNVQTLGKKPDGTLWKVGIRKPDSQSELENEISLILETQDQAVITSGGYERYFKENGETYIHILDPRTGYPADSDMKSVTIVSGNGMLADALSTSLYLMGRAEATEFWRAHRDLFEMILIDENDDIYVTQGLEKNVTAREKTKNIKIIKI